MADYVIFLYLGEVIEVGETDDVFNHPTHEKTKRYVGGLMAGV